MIRRRRVLASLALPLLQGCTAALPPLQTHAVSPEAQALLAASAAAHGFTALASVHDVNARYAGHWRGLVGILVPVLVDSGFRGTSEERLLLPDRLVTQSYTGPSGHKQVVRRTAPAGQGEVRAWFNGQESHDEAQRDAAALVADGYSLFLLGPMLLAGRWGADRSLAMQLSTPETITVGGQEYTCDVLRVDMAPGIGLSAGDELALFIDRGERLMRRVRFTLNGLAVTQGAVAEVDTWAHVTVQAVRWPTRFHEHLRHPLSIPVHDWQMEGLDLNRGLLPADVTGPALAGHALRPADALLTGA